MRHACVIMLAALAFATAAVAGQNPDVRLYVDFDPPNYVQDIEVLPGEPFDVYVMADGLSDIPEAGLWGVAFRVERTFGGTYLGTENLMNPLVPHLGEPESAMGIALASGGDCLPAPIVAVARITYLFDGTAGTIAIEPHTSEGLATADCNNEIDLATLLPGGSVEVLFTPVEERSWGAIKAMSR